MVSGRPKAEARGTPDITGYDVRRNLVDLISVSRETPPMVLSAKVTPWFQVAPRERPGVRQISPDTMCAATWLT